MKIWIIYDFYKIVNSLAQRLIAAQYLIVPDVVVKGDNDVIFIVVGIVDVDSICLVVVVVVFCIEASVCFVVGVVVITVADVEVTVEVEVVCTVVVSDIKNDDI